MCGCNRCNGCNRWNREEDECRCWRQARRGFVSMDIFRASDNDSDCDCNCNCNCNCGCC